jgi:hypothetical protein
MTHYDLCKAALDRVYQAKDSGDVEERRKAWAAFAALVNSRPEEEVTRMEEEQHLV